jgi:hypothetical protein
VKLPFGPSVEHAEPDFAARSSIQMNRHCSDAALINSIQFEFFQIPFVNLGGGVTESGSGTWTASQVETSSV